MSESENNNEWARLIYRNLIDGIEAVKRRQWATTNYILLIFAAVIGFTKLLKISCTSGYTGVEFFLLAVVFLISIMGIYHLIDMHLVMTKYRIKAFNIANKDEYKFVKEIDMIRDEKVGFFKYFPNITVLFILLVLTGLVFVIIFLDKNFGIGTPTFPIGCWIIALLVIDAFLALIFTIKDYKDAEDFKKEIEKKANKTVKRDILK